jgi:hypothetical protein
MERSERSWARIFVRRGVVAAIMILALAVYGLVTAGTQSLAFKPTASSTSGGHSVSQAVSPVNGSINVAAQGPSHTLYFYWELESSGSYTGVWHGPLGIGAPGSTFSAATIVAQGNGSAGGLGNFDIAVQGPSHTGDLYWDISGKWYGPYQFAGPGTVFGTPGMAEDSQGNLQIAVQGPSNTLYVYWNTSGAYYGPLGIGGPNSTFSAPAMSSNGDEVYATVQGRNHDLESYYVYDGGPTLNNGHGQPWSSAYDISNDNTAFDSPWAGSSGAIFQGPNNSLYQAANFFAVQLTQIRGAGTTYSTPSALGTGDYITAEGPSNTLYWYFNDVKTDTLDGPLQIGGAGSTWSAPSLIQDNVGNYDIAVQGAGNALYEYWVVGGVPHGPLGIGAPGSTFSSPN